MTGHDLDLEAIARSLNAIIAERDTLRAKLAAAEQERDDIFGEALRYKRLRIEERSRADRAEAALAAVREPQRCEHVYPDGRRCALPPLEHHAVVGLAELHGIDEPKREQS